jgi:uncharacterized membrane protein YhaH (DUF805 family)
MFDALKKYAVFTGRASRGEYWKFFLLYILLFIIASIMDGVLDLFDEDVGIGTLGALLVIGLILPSIAVTIRRLHDIDKSGWWILISFVPLLNLVILVFALLRGTQGDNRYGPDPLVSKI